VSFFTYSGGNEGKRLVNGSKSLGWRIAWSSRVGMRMELWLTIPYSQVMWMRRLRVLRRLLVKYRAAGKIDKHLYHELYHLSKGNTFKHKRALVEHVSFTRHVTTSWLASTTATTHPFRTLSNISNRFTRPRLRPPASPSSRRRWTPSVPRPRPPARGDRSVCRTSALPSRARRRRRRLPSRSKLPTHRTNIGINHVEGFSMHQPKKSSIAFWTTAGA
jgi:hypothetical protein